MATSVDQLKDHSSSVTGQVARVSTTWCHLTADSLEELHEMADRIGMRRAWDQPHALLHRCHDDLTPARRAAAIQLGAVEVNTKEHLRRLMAQGLHQITVPATS